MQKVRRKREIEGVTIPGIVKNGSYFYNQMAIYEDGMITCWKLVDLDGFQEALNSSWVVTSIPIGESISLGFGSFKVLAASWTFDKDSYLLHLKSILKKINPNLSNVYKKTKEEKELWEKRRVTFYPSDENFYVQKENFYQTAKGSGIKLFYKYKNENHLVELVVFEDGKITCFNDSFEIDYNIEDIDQYFKNGTFFTKCEEKTKIKINGLGELTVIEDYETDEILDKLTQLKENYKELLGKETIADKCVKAYHYYLEYPCDSSKERLKELYEQVPEHERMFLGDMDSKDHDYRRILYTDKKREV